MLLDTKLKSYNGKKNLNWIIKCLNLIPNNVCEWKIGIFEGLTESL